MSEPSDPLSRFRAEIDEAPVADPPAPNAWPHKWLWVGGALLAGAVSHHLLLVCGGLFLIYLCTRNR
jgi:hypothetical protein